MDERCKSYHATVDEGGNEKPLVAIRAAPEANILVNGGVLGSRNTIATREVEEQSYETYPGTRSRLL